LGFLLPTSRLVRISLIGIAGGPLLIVGFLAVLFGFAVQYISLAGFSVLLVALFEFTLGVWRVVNGLNRSTIASLSTNPENLEN
jgi:hypothetical protein